MTIIIDSKKDKKTTQKMKEKKAKEQKEQKEREKEKTSTTPQIMWRGANVHDQRELTLLEREMPMPLWWFLWLELSRSAQNIVVVGKHFTFLLIVV